MRIPLSSKTTLAFRHQDHLLGRIRIERAALGLLAALISGAALAAGGVSGESVQTLFETVLDVLQMASIPVVTIAVCWAGYKIIWGGSAIQEVGPLVVGAILIGASPWVAELLVQGGSGS